MSFNQPMINEMMARETLEYRARDLEGARRRRFARQTRRRRSRPTWRLSFNRIKQTVRNPA